MIKKLATITVGFLMLAISLSGAELKAAAADSPQWIQSQKINGKIVGDLFGFCITASDRYLAIAAKSSDGSGIQDSGVVYLYGQDKARGKWKLAQAIEAPDATAGAEFGESVALNDDTLVVGARFANANAANRAGAAYVYRLDRRRNHWVFQQKLEGEDNHEDDEFGRAVAITGKGDRLVVGARFAEIGNEDAGAVFVYRFNKKAGKWMLEQEITDENRSGGDEFGRAVAFDPKGEMLVVGARRADGNPTPDVGAVFIYALNHRKGEWILKQKLQESDLQKNDRFGQSVAVMAGTIVIGARDAEARDGDGELIANTGAVYVYKQAKKSSRWVLSQMITPADGGTRDGQYGFSLALSGHLLAVGARRNGPGAVYLYRRGGGGKWEAAGILSPGDGQTGDEFGQSLAFNPLRGGKLAIGADEANGGTGATYIFGIIRP